MTWPYFQPCCTEILSLTIEANDKSAFSKGNYFIHAWVSIAYQVQFWCMIIFAHYKHKKSHQYYRTRSCKPLFTNVMDNNLPVSRSQRTFGSKHHSIPLSMPWVASHPPSSSLSSNTSSPAASYSSSILEALRKHGTVCCCVSVFSSSSCRNFDKGSYKQHISLVAWFQALKEVTYLLASLLINTHLQTSPLQKALKECRACQTSKLPYINATK